MSFRSRFSSSSRSPAPGDRDAATGAASAARAFFTHARRLSELTPRATSVTVRPDDRTSSIASHLYSSEYRFVYLLPTWCYFLWNLRVPVSRCP